MTYLLSNEAAGTTEEFTSKRAAYKAMTAMRRAGIHYTARVHGEHGCILAGVDAIRYIKG